jgi:group I intron endonuclease
MAFIYKITNPKGKIYIGSTKQQIHKRWQRYYNLDCKTQRLLHRSLIKYGISNHKFEIIEECDDNIRFEKEREYGNQYDVLNPKVGLNLSLPKKDESDRYLSDESLEKMSISQKVRWTQEEKEKFSKKRKGLKYSQEAINNMSIGQTKRYAKRKLGAYKDGELVKTYNLIKEACEELGCNKSYICAVINKENRTAYGFHWKYIDSL